jgi:hypothetical protein
MKKLLLSTTGLLLTLLLYSQTTTNRPSIAFTYDVPDAVNTYITAISENQIVLGYYENEEGRHRGFLKQQGTLYTFDFPSATNTFPGGIDTNQVIYGTYNTGNAQEARAFRMELTPNEPTYVDINDLFNGVTFLTVNGVNNHRTFCGDYRTGPLSKLFFVDEANNIMNEQNYGINPGFPTYAGGINDNNWVSGFYIDGAAYRGFVWKGFSDYDTIRYPGQNRTKFTGINNNGYIVGTAGFGNQIGFVLDYTNGEFGEFEDIEIEGASAIWPQDINDYNEVAGYFIDTDGKAHGFLMLSEIGFDYIPSGDGFNFPNSSNPIWQASAYDGLSYETDPYLLSQGIIAPFPLQEGGLAYPSSTFPRWDYLVEAYGEGSFYHTVLGQKKIVKRKLGFWQANKSNEFDGVCYGMSLASAAFKFNRSLLESRFPVFSNSPEYLWNQTFDNQVGKALTMIQLNTWGRPYYYNYLQYRYDLTEGIVKRVIKNMFETENNPLAIWFARQGISSDAHAVFPYKVVMEDEFSYKLYCYDPNRPGDDEFFIPINKNGSFDGQATWDYTEVGFPDDHWNGFSPGNFFAIGPLETAFFLPYTFRPTSEDNNHPPTASRDNEHLQLLVSSEMDFALHAQSSVDSLGFWNNRILNDASYGIVPSTISYYGGKINNLFFEDGDYSLDIKDVADEKYTVTLSDLNTKTIYFFDRTSVTSEMDEKYQVDNGLTFINNEAFAKPMLGGLMVQTDEGETITYELENITAAAGQAIKISLVNGYMLQIDNGGIDNSYNLSISYWSNSEVHEFEVSSISFNPNATHIISPFAPGAESFNPAIFVDEGQNGSNEDTLLLENALLPNLYVEATEIRITNNGGERSLLVQNTGGGSFNWSASSPDSWISFSQNSGTNTGLLSFNSSVNPSTTESRSGVIYVEGNGQIDTIVVVQGDFNMVGSVQISSEIGLTLYPNPAVEQITISSRIPQIFKNIEVFDLAGRKMPVAIFKGVENNATVIVNSLTSGIYIVKIQTEKQEYTSKFIKN